MKSNSRVALATSSLIFVSFFILTSCLKNPNVTANFPLKFSSVKQDLGKLGWDQRRKTSFAIQNVSTRTISYLISQTNCCGVKDRKDYRTIEPGKFDSVDVDFDSTGLSGTQLLPTNITVSGFSSALTLSVIADVKPPLEVTPKELDFGNLKSGDSSKREVTFRNSGSKKIRLKLRSTSGISLLSAKKLDLSPNESAKISVELKQVAFGKYLDTIEALPNLLSIPALHVSVIADVQSKWKPSKDGFYFGFVKVGDSFSQSVSIAGLRKTSIKRCWTDFQGANSSVVLNPIVTGVEVALSATMRKAVSDTVKKSVYIETRDLQEPILIFAINGTGLDPSISECCSTKSKK